MKISLKKISLHGFIFLIKFYDLPSICYNYYDPEINYQREFIKPSSIPTIYQIIPRKYFTIISGICDFLVSRLIDSDKYFILSSFLPADIISFENLLLVLMKKGYHGICGMILTHLNIFYAPILTNEYLYILSYLYPVYEKSYETSH